MTHLILFLRNIYKKNCVRIRLYPFPKNYLPSRGRKYFFGEKGANFFGHLVNKDKKKNNKKMKSNKPAIEILRKENKQANGNKYPEIRQ